MRAAPFIATIVVASLLGLGVARAEEQPQTASTSVVVPDGGGQYEVKLHPSLITSLFLPENVERVLASDQKNFTIRQMGNAVAIRPLVPNPKLTANVVITTASLRITVILKVVDDAADAHAQVNFKKAEVEEAIQRRIDAEVERRVAEERARLRKQIDLRVAERIFRGVETKRLTAIDRNRDNVIVKVPEVARVGGDAYLFVTIQNRSGSTYRLTDVVVTAAGKEVQGAVIFNGKAALGPMLGQVPSGQSADALVVVRNVEAIRGSVRLEISEAGGRGAVRVEGISLR